MERNMDSKNKSNFQDSSAYKILERTYEKATKELSAIRGGGLKAGAYTSRRNPFPIIPKTYRKLMDYCENEVINPLKEILVRFGNEEITPGEYESISAKENPDYKNARDSLAKVFRIGRRISKEERNLRAEDLESLPNNYLEERVN